MFKRLYYKCYGYLNNLTRQAENIDNTDCQNTMSRHQNVPSRITIISTPTSNLTTVPVTPMAPTPSTSTVDSNPAPRLPPSSLNHTCTDKWVINLSKTPLTEEQLTLLQKGPNYAITPKYPP